MERRLPRRLARWSDLLIVTGVLVVCGFLIAWSGVYNVAASRGHWPIVERLLAFSMRNSVEARANFVGSPPRFSPDLVRLGAAHFHGGCAYCHGAPGQPSGQVAQHMLPPPPDMAVVASHWNERELFWIVKHGIKYTGMPAWVSQTRDDEVWAVVAFLRQISALDPQIYRELAVGDLEIAVPSGRDLATREAATEAVSACGRCHGAEAHGPKSRLVPVLHGQTSEFLMISLGDYGAGRRESGIMQPIAAALNLAEMRKVASYYAALDPPRAAARDPADADAVERGRLLASQGEAHAQIPPCMACHGGTGLDAYPRLVGQSAPYIAGQLRLLRAAVSRRSPAGGIMIPIARRLSDRQIDDVAAFFASFAVREGGEETGQ